MTFQTRNSSQIQHNPKSCNSFLSQIKNRYRFLPQPKSGYRCFCQHKMCYSFPTCNSVLFLHRCRCLPTMLFFLCGKLQPLIYRVKLIVLKLRFKKNRSVIQVAMYDIYLGLLYDCDKFGIRTVSSRLLIRNIVLNNSVLRAVKFVPSRRTSDTRKSFVPKMPVANLEIKFLTLTLFVILLNIIILLRVFRSVISYYYENRDLYVNVSVVVISLSTGSFLLVKVSSYRSACSFWRFLWRLSSTRMYDSIVFIMSSESVRCELTYKFLKVYLSRLTIYLFNYLPVYPCIYVFFSIKYTSLTVLVRLLTPAKVYIVYLIIGRKKIQ